MGFGLKVSDSVPRVQKLAVGLNGMVVENARISRQGRGFEFVCHLAISIIPWDIRAKGCRPEKDAKQLYFCFGLRRI